MVDFFNFGMAYKRLDVFQEQSPWIFDDIKNLMGKKI